VKVDLLEFFWTVYLFAVRNSTTPIKSSSIIQSVNQSINQSIY